jgi:hypothetical protein
MDVPGHGVVILPAAKYCIFTYKDTIQRSRLCVCLIPSLWYVWNCSQIHAWNLNPEMSSASTLFSMVKSSSEVPRYSHRAPSSSRVEPKSSRGHQKRRTWQGFSWLAATSQYWWLGSWTVSDIWIATQNTPDRAAHVARLCCQAIVYFTQIHPHHLPISRFFPKDPQNSWGPQNNKIGISLVHLKYPLKHEKIWTRSSRSLDLTSLVKTGWQVWTSWKGSRNLNTGDFQV